MYQKIGTRAFKAGIDSMLAFDKALGMPHKNYPVIHIAGTNGKGSVSHMLTSVMMRCGLKTGLYTSPHLLDFRERIRINGEMISKEQTLDFIDRWKPFMLENRPSFFEITTAMAFSCFAAENVDIAVIETGLGGRLDSTNIVMPILSIITNIGLDHCMQLGYTISEIAREKGGIIKEGIPVVIGEANRTTADIFNEIAADRGAKILYAQKQRFKDVILEDYELDMKGCYQVYNLRTVLTALSILNENVVFKGLIGKNWNDDNIRKGLKSVISSTGLRGRWEYLSVNPKVICDTGHNFHGLSEVFSQLRRESFMRLFSIIGFAEDKDIDRIVNILPESSYYYYTQANIPRAMDAVELEKKCSSAGLNGMVKSSVEEAILEYFRKYQEGDLLFIGGSNYIVAEAIDWFSQYDNGDKIV